MFGGNDEHQLIFGKGAEFQMRAVLLSADQAEMDLPLLDLLQHLLAIGHGRANLDMGMPFLER